MNMKSDIYFLYLPKPYLTNPGAQYGLGLIYLATYAESLGATVHIVNAQCEPEDWLGQEIPDGSVVCISACYVDTYLLSSLCKGLKKRRCYIAIGGPISDSPEAVDARVIDYVVKGPGEPFMESLVGGKRPTGLVDQLYGVDFDKYPMPNRRLMNECYGGNIFHPKTGVKAEKSTTLLTSRGCPFRCAFCNSGNNKMMFSYSMERITKEIADIASLGIQFVRMSDENLLFNRTRLYEVCKLLDKYNIRWRASIRARPNDIDMYQYMVDHGCVEISVGIESADDDVLKMFCKDNLVADNTTCIENALKAGLPNIRALMMMCTPGETYETLDKNKLWVESFPDIVVSLCAFYPFPGTAIYENPKNYSCRIEAFGNQNICTFRADGTEPEAHISIIGGMSRDELTEHFLEMRRFLDNRGQANHG